MTAASGLETSPCPPAVRRPALRVALIGWGSVSRRLAELLARRDPDSVALAGVALRRPEIGNTLPDGVRVFASPEELAAAELDLVIEAAGREAVGQWAEAAFAAAPAYAISSTSALCDNKVLGRLIALAEARGGQILIPPGALAGIDGLAAASALDLTSVLHTIIKPPAAWRGTLAEKLVQLDSLTKPETFFKGSAREAASAFPQNANVAVITALAGCGLDATRIELVADPAAVRNSHRIVAEGDFGRLELTIENRPLAANPRTSELTALNLVRLIENRFRPLVF